MLWISDTLFLRFAFNCGSAESIESKRMHVRMCSYVLFYGNCFVAGFHLSKNSWNADKSPFYGVPAVIAINMIMAGASGGTVAILIAVWAQVGWYRGEGRTTVCD